MTSIPFTSRVLQHYIRPDATLGDMVRMVRADYSNAQVVELAARIAMQVREKNEMGIAQAVLAWLRAHTRFVADPVGVQLLKDPLYLLQLIRADGVAAGDCVDIAMLGAALALAVGLPATFVAEAYEGDPVTAPLVHVYTIVQTREAGWLSLDTQRPVGAPELRAVRQVKRVVGM